MRAASMPFEAGYGSAAIPTRPPAGRWLTAAALAACWGPWWWRLARVWSLTPEQAYGWAVPLLALWCAYERRRDEPPGFPPGRAGCHLASAVLVGALGGFALALPVLEANPMW